MKKTLRFEPDRGDILADVWRASAWLGTVGLGSFTFCGPMGTLTAAELREIAAFMDAQVKKARGK